jgi:hypothetical protein
MTWIIGLGEVNGIYSRSVAFKERTLVWCILILLKFCGTDSVH